MAENEIFQALRDVIEGLEKACDGMDTDDAQSISHFSRLYKSLEELSFILKDIKIEKNASKGLSEDGLEALAALASAYDKSDDELLRKEAAVLDEILLTIGASKRQVAEMKQAHELEIARLKSLAEDKKDYDPYTIAKSEHDKQNKVSEVEKLYKDKVKEYRSMEAPLMTRSCPDHPGAQMSRVSEHTFQCSLDKGIYNFQSGYTTLKGSKVPGGDVSEQTHGHDRTNEITSFDTRESRLNQL